MWDEALWLRSQLGEVPKGAGVAARQRRLGVRERFGQQVKAARDAAGMTSAELANVLDVSPARCSTWLAGNARMSIEEFLSCARLLQREPEDLLVELIEASTSRTGQGSRRSAAVATTGKPAGFHPFTRPLSAPSAALSKEDRPETGADVQKVEWDRIAVVDVETTGFSNSDRIVEIAIVTLSPEGAVIDEFDTLIHPGRDPGPTHVHGITSSMLSGAPRFQDVAAAVAARLHGAVIAAHNLPFDARMLELEFSRLGHRINLRRGFDTYRLTRSRLEVACREHGIVLSDAHTALGDARATAKLLARLGTSPGRRVHFAILPPDIPRGSAGRSRSSAPRVQAPDRLLRAWQDQLVDLARIRRAEQYHAALDALASQSPAGGMDASRVEATARRIGLPSHEREHIELEWLRSVIDRAIDDGEGSIELHTYEHLLRWSFNLGLGFKTVNRRTTVARTRHGTVRLTAGQGVHFTGNTAALPGDLVSRGGLIKLCKVRGMRYLPRISTSASIVVAVAPGNSESASRVALRYGTPIVALSDFVRSEPGQEVAARLPSITNRRIAACQRCGDQWLAGVAPGTQVTLCPACRPSRPRPRGTVLNGVSGLA